VQALERRKVLVTELVDAFRRGQILEPVRAEIAELLRSDERRSGGGDEDLAAVTARRDARGAVTSPPT
jgi:hypothetical protein